MSEPATGTGDFLSRLRDQTRAEHVAIEAVLGLIRSDLTVESYRHVLERFYGFYRPVEDALEVAGGWESSGLNLNERKKVPLLEADLQFLGLECPAQLPVCRDLPPLDVAAARYGCLYVLEGATLGGQYISQHIRQVLGLEPQAGARFFQGYGEQTGAMWQAFRTALRHFAASPALQDRVVASATATFRALRLWCQGRDTPCPTSTL
ncbi:MAG: biliverdin-producing heme oxygenase [Isosphaeraceae bacterium]